MPSEMTTPFHEYTIVLASPSQIQQYMRVKYIHWHCGSMWETFVAAYEHEMKTSKWAKDDGLLDWVLVRRDDPEGEFYAACQTYRRNGLVRKAGNRDVESCWLYLIGGVVTSPAHLRRGYATHLLRLLHYHLADNADLPPFPSQWGPPPPKPSAKIPKSIASTLYSDVGADFYRNCTIGTSLPGWVVDPKANVELDWELLPVEEEAKTNEWDLLHAKDMPEIEELLSNSLTQALKDSSEQQTIVVHDPSSVGSLWIVAEKGAYGSTSTDSPPLGARQDDTVVLFTATNVIVYEKLLVTCTHKVQSDGLASLLKILDRAGAKANRTSGIVWGLDDETIATWKDEAERQGRKITVRERKGLLGHLLAVARYGKEKGIVLDSQLWPWC
ncbi:hypothetical protein P7C73_g4848, partial [Tremellales sp. Uapishka_1]